MPIELVGQSEATKELVAEALYAARTNAKVLITGEKGVGKKEVARFIHARSARASRPLNIVECAGASDTDLEIELFGVGEVDSSGIETDRLGKIERSAGGTIVLANVHTLNPHLQWRLLQFLESGEIRRFGSDEVAARPNVRIITTAPDLSVMRELLATQAFREDLWYRLNVINLHVRPLRERPSDILPLLTLFWAEHSLRPGGPSSLNITDAAVGALAHYQWPGNVEELQAVSERLHLTISERESPTIDVNDLPPHITGRQHSEAPPDFEIVFSEEFSPREVKDLLTAFADYFRACGGLGLKVQLEAEEVSAREPVDA